MMAEPVNSQSDLGMAGLIEAGGRSDAEIQPHAAVASESQEPSQTDSVDVGTINAASTPASDEDVASGSDTEEDRTAVNACKALLYAAANAVLFGIARLLHGTFTSY